jgi:hypothetical protein
MDQARLIELGFTYVGTCNCHGGLNKKYKRAEFLIYIKQSQFKVKKFGTTVKGYSDIQGLEAYIQKAFPFLFAGE